MAGRKGKRHEEGHVNHERYLVTYADLITLLMVFFIVMFATASQDRTRFAAVAASLAKAFNTRVLEGQDPVALHGQDGLRVTAPTQAEPTPAAGANGPSQVDLLRAALADAIGADMAPLLQQRGLQDQVTVEQRPDGVLITISGALLFDSGQAVLQPGAGELLWTLGARLPGIHNDIRIVGHTDDVPIETAEFPSNWELSSARALAVLHFFAQDMHIPPERLSAVGQGQFRPVAPNDTLAGRAKNRRVEILIVDQDARPIGESHP